MPPAPKVKAPKPKPAGGRSDGSKRNLWIAVGAAVIVVALAAGAIVLSTTGGDDSSSPPTTDTNGAAFLDGIPQEGTFLGNPEATVVLLSYEDLQCPVCKRFTETGFRTIVDEYVRPGDVRLDYRGLDFIGDDSTKALRHVLAAGRQNKAWQLIDLLFASQGAENSGWVTDELLRELGGQIEGLDVEQMFADAGTQEITDEIAAVSADAAEKQVPGTPWFYVQIGDDEPYEVQPTSLEGEAFRPILDDALSG